jgi:hypothetical protein
MPTARAKTAYTTSVVRSDRRSAGELSMRDDRSLPVSGDEPEMDGITAISFFWNSETLGFLELFTADAVAIPRWM